MSEKVVSIFGTSRAKEGDPVYIQAENIGRQLAKESFVIANGGYGGTMLASARGARQAGGKVIGVTCSAFNRSCANEYVTEQIVTKSLDERLAVLTELGQGYVVLQGGTGTLLELARVWEMKNKGFTALDKPIVFAGRFWQPLVELMAEDNPKSAQCVHLALRVDEIIEILIDTV